MLEFYSTIDNKLVKINEATEGCWINVVSPTITETNYLINTLGVEKDFVNVALDEEESSRIESEDNQTLIIVDHPVAIKEKNEVVTYETFPMALIITPTNVITICLNENSTINDIVSGMVKNIQTHLKTRFVLTILLRIAQNFLVCLKQINRKFTFIERQLNKTMKNKELLQILALRKALVYFSTSLKSNEITLEKILRGRVIALYEDDQDLLEDVLIEVKQGVDMSKIYSAILANTVEAFASVISNNLNISMKFLTIITAILAIPNMVYGFYGMNVADLPFDGSAWPALIISIVLSILGGVILFSAKSNK